MAQTVEAAGHLAAVVRTGGFTTKEGRMDAVARKHQMIVMDHTGDYKIIWDEDSEAEVEEARKQFDSLRKKGYAAYLVDKKGEKGDVITKFDPGLEKLIMAPALKGG